MSDAYIYKTHWFIGKGIWGGSRAKNNNNKKEKGGKKRQMKKYITHTISTNDDYFFIMYNIHVWVQFQRVNLAVYLVKEWKNFNITKYVDTWQALLLVDRWSNFTFQTPYLLLFFSVCIFIFSVGSLYFKDFTELLASRRKNNGKKNGPKLITWISLGCFLTNSNVTKDIYDNLNLCNNHSFKWDVRTCYTP